MFQKDVSQGLAFHIIHISLSDRFTFVDSGSRFGTHWGRGNCLWSRSLVPNFYLFDTSQSAFGSAPVLGPFLSSTTTKVGLKFGSNPEWQVPSKRLTFHSHIETDYTLIGANKGPFLAFLDHPGLVRLQNECGCILCTQNPKE